MDSNVASIVLPNGHLAVIGEMFLINKILA